MVGTVLPAIRLEREGNLGIITLARPEAANAIGRDFAENFRAIVTECNFDRAIGVVLIRAEGGLFCAGNDIASYAQAGHQLHYLLRDLTEDFHGGLIRLAHMRKPVVTAIQGATAGAGFALALAGDIVIAAQSASFQLNYPAMGLSPDAGTTWILPRLVGVRRAQEMALLNHRLTASQALEMGLITRVVADDELAAESLLVARQLAEGPVRALGAARALIIEGLGRSYDEQLEAEARSMVETARLDGPESIAVLLAHRRG